MGDIVSGISSAIALAGRLREISKNIENAEFKSLLADLHLELADAKIKMAGLMDENATLKERIKSLTSTSGERCPKCGQRAFQLVSSKPHPIFGDVGGMEREYKCASCGFVESKLVTP